MSKSLRHVYCTNNAHIYVLLSGESFPLGDVCVCVCVFFFLLGRWFVKICNAYFFITSFVEHCIMVLLVGVWTNWPGE